MKVSFWWTAILLALFGLLLSPADARADDVGNLVATSLIVILVLLVVFLIFREFVCWYWKQNEIVGLLREIRDTQALGKSKHQGESSEKRTESAVEPSFFMGPGQIPFVAPAGSDTGNFCHHCGEPVPVEAKSCTSCGKDLGQDDLAT